jgi:hypothetical protein
MYHLTAVTSNRKVGRIPASTSGRETCPKDCPFCYARTGPQALHWKKVTTGERGATWREFCEQIRRLARATYWRHNVSGDLPHSLGEIVWGAMRRLVLANRGKHGWTYTHHSTTAHNVRVVQYCNNNGFTVNWSADNVIQADRIAEYGPVAVIMPTGTPKVSYTPHGHKVVICPAEWHGQGRVTCAQCRLCTKARRKYMIGFLPHGTYKKLAHQIAS